MNGAVAHCTSCQIAFAMPGFMGAGEISFTGCITTCPKCGKTASIGDASYKFQEDGSVILIGGHPFTGEMFNRLRDIASRAAKKIKTNTAEAEQILAEVADISPELAKKIEVT